MKERLLADLDARIARHAIGDPSGVLDETVLDVVTELTATGEPDAVSLARVAALHMCRSQALPPEHREIDLRLARALYTTLHTVDPRLVPPDVRNALGLGAPQDIGVAMLREYERAGQAEHLERAISLFRQEVLERRPDRATNQHRLGLALIHRFERFGDPANLHEAIDLCRGAVAGTPFEARRAEFQATLARGLRDRFELSADPADLDEARRLAAS